MAALSHKGIRIDFIILRCISRGEKCSRTLADDGGQSAEDGYCEVNVPHKLKYDGVFESFHGGLLMTIADSTACFAILTRTGPETRLTTTDMNIRFLAPCLSDVTARARVIKFGRTMCPATVDLFDGDNNQVAVAQVNYMILDNLNK